MKAADRITSRKACYHFPGLFEFEALYTLFLPLFFKHREYFYDWCDIGSIYGAPADCLWGGGRTGYGNADAPKLLTMMEEYGISARLTFSNLLLREEHLNDRRCNRLCEALARGSFAKVSESGRKKAENGVIIGSDILAEHIRKNYPELYLVSSTTKVITDMYLFREELAREEFRYVVPDFRLNRKMEGLLSLPRHLKDKVEFLCNEGCWFGCPDRRACYENVSLKALGEDVEDHICKAPGAEEGYVFSRAMRSPGFIGIRDIQQVYLPGGFSQFKIEGRSLGSALVLEFLLYYMTKPEYQLEVREAIYLDASLDLF